MATRSLAYNELISLSIRARMGYAIMIFENFYDSYQGDCIELSSLLWEFTRTNQLDVWEATIQKEVYDWFGYQGPIVVTHTPIQQWVLESPVHVREVLMLLIEVGASEIYGGAEQQGIFSLAALKKFLACFSIDFPICDWPDSFKFQEQNPFGPLLDKSAFVTLLS